MGREILFRGQHIRTLASGIVVKEWLYGYFSRITYCDGKGEQSYIKTSGYEPAVVDSDTVGQFTEQHDNSEARTKIFGGDILKMWIEDSVEPDGGIWHYMYVKWTVEKGFVLWGKNMTIEDAATLYEMLQWKQMEVVGNIHDNPKLIDQYHGIHQLLRTTEAKIGGEIEHCHLNNNLELQEKAQRALTTILHELRCGRLTFAVPNKEFVSKFNELLKQE